VIATNPLPGGNADALDVQVQIKSVEVNIVDKAGKKVDSTETGQGVYRVAVRWIGQRWVAADFALEST
jgi:hypothetical protein